MKTARDKSGSMLVSQRDAHNKDKTTVGLKEVTTPTEKILDEFVAKIDERKEKKHHK